MKYGILKETNVTDHNRTGFCRDILAEFFAGML